MHQPMGRTPMPHIPPEAVGIIAILIGLLKPPR
jgi:hypothetical protein